MKLLLLKRSGSRAEFLSLPLFRLLRWPSRPRQSPSHPRQPFPPINAGWFPSGTVDRGGPTTSERVFREGAFVQEVRAE